MEGGWVCICVLHVLCGGVGCRCAVVLGNGECGMCTVCVGCVCVGVCLMCVFRVSST